MAMKGYGNQEHVTHSEGGKVATQTSEGANPLAGAVKELYHQHPHNYDDHGPHQGTSDHVRHKPVVHGPKNTDKPV